MRYFSKVFTILPNKDREKAIRLLQRNTISNIRYKYYESLFFVVICLILIIGTSGVSPLGTLALFLVMWSRMSRSSVCKKALRIHEENLKEMSFENNCSK